MSREKLEAFIQLFLLDHGHAVEDEVIRELVEQLGHSVEFWDLQSKPSTGKKKDKVKE